MCLCVCVCVDGVNILCGLLQRVIQQIGSEFDWNQCESEDGNSDLLLDFEAEQNGGMLHQNQSKKDPRVDKLRKWIGSAKSNGFGPKHFADQPQYQAILELYNREIRQRNAIDFNSFVPLAVKLLKANYFAKEKYQSKHRFVLVDEYQDCSESQLSLLECLVGHTGHITAVGDDDQAIYGFRGTSSRCMERFREIFPACSVSSLAYNYRSTRTIVACASELISHNSNRYKKDLRAALPRDGTAVQIVMCSNPKDEAAQIATEIQRLKQSGRPVVLMPLQLPITPLLIPICTYGRPYADICVLYRSHFAARELESAMKAHP